MNNGNLTGEKNNGWTATEDQFLKGICGPTPKLFQDSDMKGSNPYASYMPGQPMPSTIRLLVILVKFSDLANTLTKAQMQEKIFGSANSVADYWNEVTFGAVTITGSVTEWLTLPNTREYYGRDNGDDIDSYYGSSTKIDTAAIDVANPSVNYANYDKVMIVHAGNDQAQSGQDYDVWSHAVQPFWGPYWLRDNTYIYTSSCVAENEQIGTYCHEFGHQCDLPDLYDTVGSNNYVNNWCLMDAGNWIGSPAGSSPAHPTGWCKNFLGLIPESKIKTVLDTQCHMVTLDDLETGGSNYYLAKIPLADANQYYLVEARFLSGYDSALPGEGIIITKIDTTKWGGQGIVTVMDSRPSTATKNDGEFDYESVETENGIWHDYTNNIHIIIKSQTASSFTIMIDRKNTWTMTQYYIAAQTTVHFDLGYDGLVVSGQKIGWHWKDDTGGSDNLDSWLRINDATNVEVVEDYGHDSGLYQVTTSSLYQLYIRNENLLLSTTYDLYFVYYNANDVRMIDVDLPDQPVYEFNNFTVTATMQNWGDQVVTGTKMRFVPTAGDIGFQPGQSNMMNGPNLAEWETFTATWKLTALRSVDNSQIRIQPFTSVGYDWYTDYVNEIDLLNDAIAPQVTIISPHNGEITPDPDIVVEWSGSDGQSGLKQFKIFSNGTLMTTLSALEDNCILSDLGSGHWNLTVQAIDYAGNIKNTSISILIDSELPTVNAFECNATWVRSGSECQFTIAGHDAYSGLHIAQIYLETAPDTWVLCNSDMFSGTTSVISVPLGTLSGASLRFKTIIEDHAGNTAESDPITLLIDNSIPTLSMLSIVSDSGNPSAIGGVMNISVLSSDIGSGIEAVVVNLTYLRAFSYTSKINSAVYNPTSGRFEYSCNTTKLIIDRTVTITVTAIDNAGNTYQVQQTVYVSNLPKSTTLPPLNPLIIVVILGVCAGAGAIGLVTVKKAKLVRQGKRNLADSIDFSDGDASVPEGEEPSKKSEFGLDELFEAEEPKRVPTVNSTAQDTRLGAASKDETEFEF